MCFFWPYLFRFGLLEGELHGGHSQLVGEEIHISGQLQRADGWTRAVPATNATEQLSLMESRREEEGSGVGWGGGGARGEREKHSWMRGKTLKESGCRERKTPITEKALISWFSFHRERKKNRLNCFRCRSFIH